MVCVCALFSLTGCYNTEPRESVLKIYNWADYIDEDMLAEFPRWYKEQTGEDIRIVYQTFDINEIMLTKIERGHEDFDVVCPSEYIIERMLRKGLLLPIDTVFGPGSNYSVCTYQSFTGGDVCINADIEEVKTIQQMPPPSLPSPAGR